MRVLAFWSVLLWCTLGLVAHGATVDSIPKPPAGSWSVDTTRTLSASTRAEVDRVGAEVDAAGLGRLYVVVVDTTGGRKPRTFATQLFNRWGIGHGQRNDGVLLFIALKDRKAEIVLGDGVDEPADIARSDAVMSGRIVPAFKRRDPDGAVREGVQGLRELLENSALNASQASATPPSAPPAQGVLIVGSTPVPLPPLPASQVSEPENESDSNTFAYAFIGGGSGALILGGLGARRLMRRRPRRCAHCKRSRQLLDEVEEDDHLDSGQQREEDLGSVDYDVWWCASCEDALVLPYGSFSAAYSKCPSCDYKTQYESSRTLVEATYSHGGELEVTIACEHCSHRESFMRYTPQLSAPESSSNSSSSSSDSSSSYSYSDSSSSSSDSSSSSSSSDSGSSSGSGSSGDW